MHLVVSEHTGSIIVDKSSNIRFGNLNRAQLQITLSNMSAKKQQSEEFNERCLTDYKHFFCKDILQ
mgnify:CR=1 FL=1